MTRRWRILLPTALMLMLTTPALGVPRAPASAFQSSGNCSCHDELVATWSVSMHAKALTDPIYLHEVARAREAGGAGLAKFCESCHAPVAIMAGMDPLKFARLPQQALEGVTCDFCHQVSDTKRKVGNASFLVDAPGPKRAQLSDAHSPVHETEYSGFHETAAFCGMCHDVFHPGNGLRLEGTYTEWKNGPYPARKIFCQDCHMTPGPGVTFPNPGAAAVGGPDRGHIFTMTFAGGNVGLGDSERAEQRLKAAAQVRIEGPAFAPEGRETTVSVIVANVGAGHYLPTGLTEVRQMWLEITATDASGRTVRTGRRDFRTVLADGFGNEGVDVWDAVSVASDDRIPPGEEVAEEFELPAGAKRPIRVSARLRYRSASKELAKASGVELPTTEMAGASLTVFESAAQQRGDAPPAVLAAIAFAVAIGGVIVLRRRQRREESM